MKEWHLEANDHNHNITEEIWKSTAKQRKLTDEDKEKVRRWHIIKSLYLAYHEDRFIDWSSTLADLPNDKHDEYEVVLSTMDPLVRSQSDPLGVLKAAISD